MAEKTWLGAIYLKDEGGYEIILRALNHYKNRLRTINSSPEITGAPMFVQIVQQEAMKIFPKIQNIIIHINESLNDVNSLNQLQDDISFIVKSLNSYKTDLQKALAESNPYYTKLIPDAKKHEGDLALIDNALQKINQFS
jgi:GTP:adenosylcobinamide-phosphate guanylyltransferase